MGHDIIIWQNETKVHLLLFFSNSISGSILSGSAQVSFCDFWPLYIRSADFSPSCRPVLRGQEVWSFRSSLLWLEEAQAGIKIARRNINKLGYADDTTLMAESEEELKSLLLDESERGEWKSWLKTQHSENEDHGIQSHHFMENRWGNSGNSVRLFFWAPKSLQMVTAAMKLKDTYSLEEKLWPT